MTALALACASMLFAADPIEVSLRKSTDRATITQNDDRVTISVESKSGIGAATLSPGEKGWPKQLRLELGLKGLEGCSITGTDVRLQTSLGNKAPEALRRRAEKWEPIDLDPELAPMIEKKNDRILIDIPPAWLRGEQLKVEWIDFYRG